MPSVYPGALDSLATDKSDVTMMTVDHPTHHNDLADAVNKIEAELGIAPSGGYATLKARLAGRPFDVKDYGADTILSDNAAAIQATIDAAKTVNGTVILDAPYNVGSALNLNDILKGVALQGTPGAELVYTAAAGSLATIKSSHDVTIRDLGLRYNHAAYNGHLIDCDDSGANRDVYRLLIDRCKLGGMSTSSRSAASLVRLNKTICSTIRNCDLRWGVLGILGRDTNFSVKNNILDNAFVLHTISTALIKNPGEGWSIRDNTFEALFDHTARAVLVGSAADALGLEYSGNWHGDADVNGGDWFKVASGSILAGASITGNRFATAGAGSGNANLRFDGQCSGLHIAGNRCEGNTGIIFTDFCRGVHIAGNDLNGCTNKITGASFLQEPYIVGNYGLPAYVTVASAATLTVPVGARVLDVTGTTTITGMTAGYAGQRVTLIFAGALTVNDSATVNLSAAFVTTAGDSLTLDWNGSQWVEAGRSVN